MTRTFDPTVERDASYWPLLAAAILVIQGLSTLFYATFLPAPLTQVGIDVPALGTMPFTWIALGGIAIVAGVGVAARLTWARYLGAVSAVLTIATGLFGSQDMSTGALAFLLPAVVLLTLWRKWPAPTTTPATTTAATTTSA